MDISFNAHNHLKWVALLIILILHMSQLKLREGTNLSKSFNQQLAELELDLGLP